MCRRPWTYLIDVYLFLSFGFPAAREVVDISGRCIFGTEPSQMSVLYYLMYASAAGGMDPLISSKKDIGGQEMKIKVIIIKS